VVAEGNFVRIEGLQIHVNDNRVGLRLMTHLALVTRNRFYALAPHPRGLTCIKLDSQLTGGMPKGAWITDLTHNCLDLNRGQDRDAGPCVGIHCLGAANRVNISQNTVAGFPGVGVLIEELSPAVYPHLINIVGNDIENLGPEGSARVGIDIPGRCYCVNVRDNYMEGIVGNDRSHFIRAGLSGAKDRVVRVLNVTGNLFDFDATSGLRAIVLGRVYVGEFAGNYLFSRVPGAKTVDFTPETQWKRKPAPGGWPEIDAGWG
jgi:hypothetical protein